MNAARVHCRIANQSNRAGFLLIGGLLIYYKPMVECKEDREIKTKRKNIKNSEQVTERCWFQNSNIIAPRVHGKKTC